MKQNNSKFKIVFAFLLVLITLSCAKVNFGKQIASTGGSDQVTATGTAVQCTTYLNDHATTATVTSSAQNPKVIAECQPSQVTYSWTVTKSPSSVVTINGLEGASSTGDFFSAGAGTYSVVLTASASGYTDYTSSPLTVTVQSTVAPNTPSITCSVTLNGSATSVTVPAGGTNPTVAAVCQPADGAYVWSVTKDGVTATVPGLNGSSSTPQFSSMPPGRYLVYVQVSRTGYQAYQMTTPLTVTVTAASTRTVTLTKTVTAQDNQLDILLVVDDSNSMLANSQKLAARLQGLVTDLGTAGFDWQMCTTVTRAIPTSQSDATLYWGSSIVWSGQSGSQSWILKPTTPNLSQVFTNTINSIGAGWAGTEDERAIKAAWWHLWNGDPNYSPVSGCYRKGAGLAVVIIGNEDERSIGGDKSQQYYANEYYPLESDDLPQTYVSNVKSVFGNDKRFTVNSIVVRPGDTACMASQDAQGTKSHYGVKLAELSQLTNGYVGSICDDDYSTNLKYFKDKIVNQMKSLPLECVPVGAVNVTLNPTANVSSSVVGQSLVFTPALSIGTQVTISYQCAQ